MQRARIVENFWKRTKLKGLHYLDFKTDKRQSWRWCSTTLSAKVTEERVPTVRLIYKDAPRQFNGGKPFQ